MTGSVTKETLRKAFQSEDNFCDFIEKFSEYYEYMLIMSMAHPGFEMTFEEYAEETWQNPTTLK